MSEIGFEENQQCSNYLPFYLLTIMGSISQLKSRSIKKKEKL